MLYPSYFHLIQPIDQPIPHEPTEETTTIFLFLSLSISPYSYCVLQSQQDSLSHSSISPYPLKQRYSSWLFHPLILTNNMEYFLWIRRSQFIRFLCHFSTLSRPWTRFYKNSFIFLFPDEWLSNMSNRITPVLIIPYPSLQSWNNEYKWEEVLLFRVDHYSENQLIEYRS